MTGAPAIRVPIARRALAVTTALSGSGPASRRSFTAAIPTLVVTVSAASGARAVSLVTSATFAPGPPPGDPARRDRPRPPGGAAGPGGGRAWGPPVPGAGGGAGRG